jgi:A/G-specific adenine glycosylase
MAAEGRQRFSLEEVEDIRARLLKWGDAHFRDLPWRRPIPFWTAIVAEVMLHRTRAAQVAPVFEAFSSRFRQPSDIARATDEELAKHLAALGLTWRIRLLIRLLREISDRRGELPRDLTGLQELPGVGPYAAAAALSLHGGQRAVMVDANIVRLVCRLLATPYDGETRRKQWLREAVDSLTPAADFQRFNYAMLDLADAVCRPRHPRCRECPLLSQCRTGAAIVQR